MVEQHFLGGKSSLIQELSGLLLLLFILGAWGGGGGGCGEPGWAAGGSGGCAINRKRVSEGKSRGIKKNILIQN